MGTRGLRYTDAQKAEIKAKRMATMEAKYGEYSEVYRRNGLKAKRTGTGGFKQAAPEYIKAMSKKGLEKRWGNRA